jgi:hypothetical protein
MVLGGAIAPLLQKKEFPPLLTSTPFIIVVVVLLFPGNIYTYTYYNKDFYSTMNPTTTTTTENENRLPMFVTVTQKNDNDNNMPYRDSNPNDNNNNDDDKVDQVFESYCHPCGELSWQSPDAADWKGNMQGLVAAATAAGGSGSDDDDNVVDNKMTSYHTTTHMKIKQEVEEEQEKEDTDQDNHMEGPDAYHLWTTGFKKSAEEGLQKTMAEYTDHGHTLFNAIIKYIDDIKPIYEEYQELLELEKKESARLDDVEKEYHQKNRCLFSGKDDDNMDSTS